MCGDWADVAGTTADTSKMFSLSSPVVSLELSPHPLSGGYWDLGVWVFYFNF